MFPLPGYLFIKIIQTELQVWCEEGICTMQLSKKGDTQLIQLAKEAIFVPESATADKALRLLLSEHYQLAIVVDEFGSVVGVIAMEDIIESIIGQEIFEHDDPAVDMRELAKRKNK